MPSQTSQPEEADFIRELTKHQQVIGAFIKSLLPVHADVDALLQEVNVTLWEKRPEFQQGSNFKAWAFQVAKYHALNERRKLQRNQLLVFDDAVINQLIQLNPAEEQAMSKKQAALEHCLTMLSTKNRQLVRARYTKGESLEKYAANNGCNAGTLRATLRRIRIKLKDCINQQIRHNEA